MRSSFFSSFLLLGLIASLGGCELIPEGQYYDIAPSDIIVKDPNADLYPDSIRPKRVLIEEFTGHQCGNCPAASETTYDLAYKTLPNNTVLVLIHAGDLANTKSGTGKYEADYRTAEGTELYEYYKFIGVPYGLVDRTKRPGSSNSYLINPVNFETQTRAQLGQTLDTLSEVRILLSGSYASDTRTFSGRIDLKYLIAPTDPANEVLSLYLVEDSVVSWQTDYRLNPTPDIADYAHHDLLRKFLNGTFGQPIVPNGEPIAAGDRYYRTIEIELPEGYRANHCKLIAFVHNLATRKVRQAEYRYLL